MRILIVGINFHPELTGIGKYTGEMSAYLSAAGHQVRVVTAPPYYPQWEIGTGYRARAYRRERWSGVMVYRCPLWVPRTPNGLKRVLHLLSFALSSLPVLLGQLPWRPQVVLCVAPALSAAPAAWLLARLSGAQAWLHIQDFELDAAAGLGMLGSAGRLAGWAARLERGLLRVFDRVSSLSPRMRARLEEKDVPPEKTGLFPNWVDPDEIFPLPYGPKKLRKEFGLPPDKTLVLYSGNMGVKQGLEIVLEAAYTLRQHPGLHFVLCGEGSARASLERAAREMRNVQFLPLQPPEMLNRLLNVADIHLLPQRADAADLVMPSKLLGMLASGKAVLATAHPDTEVGKVVGQAGRLVPPGDLPALCSALLALEASPGLRTDLGKKGRAFVCKHWSAEQVLGDFALQLRELVPANTKVSPAVQYKSE